MTTYDIKIESVDGVTNAIGVTQLDWTDGCFAYMIDDKVSIVIPLQRIKKVEVTMLVEEKP